ncbi:MAG: hypothetical protein KME10_28645 [Plectolyngbya sp. WJT66-NPBG17]|nr:hypothetical protein [Plectolyngbya sp. WJT66-NPBG17]
MSRFLLDSSQYSATPVFIVTGRGGIPRNSMEQLNTGRTCEISIDQRSRKFLDRFQY